MHSSTNAPQFVFLLLHDVSLAVMNRMRRNRPYGAKAPGIGRSCNSASVFVVWSACSRASLNGMIAYRISRMLSNNKETHTGVQSLRHRRRRVRLEVRSCNQRECAEAGSVGEKAMWLPLSIRSANLDVYCRSSMPRQAPCLLKSNIKP